QIVAPTDGLEVRRTKSPTDGQEACRKSTTDFQSVAQIVAQIDGLEVRRTKAPTDGLEACRKSTTDFQSVAQSVAPTDGLEVRRTKAPTYGLEVRRTKTPTDGLEVRRTKALTDGRDAAPAGFSFQQQKDRLRILLRAEPIVDFVFHDEKIRRPYFANARLTDERQVTRNHPPVKDVDAVDHDTMHPGIWLGFGDISGQDFWRNKAAMEHVRFVTAPTIADGRLRFTTECRLQTSQGEPLCLLTNDFTLTARPNGWLLVWKAEFRADQREIVFGDQEEMGFGARVATPFTEKNGGTIRSSTGKRTAKETWGQPAKWCDYSGPGPQSGGILLMASDKNFRESWWHNRDYGVFVANPFGREAMKQGARSAITVAKGETLKITFGALIHDGSDHDSAREYEAFLKSQKE
ncbi:MAG: DUF6807 family protein, partial [Planctomycetota bacterium]